MNHWYALTVIPRREFEAADSLTRRAFEVYVPMVRNWRHPNRYTKRKALRSYALMPGYCFLASPHAYPEWHRALNARYVRGVIAVDTKPTQIPIGQMESLAEREEFGEFTAWNKERFMRSNHEFGVNDIAEIVTGPLSSRRGRVIEIGEREAKMLLHIFGAEQFVSVGLEALEAVAA